MNDFLRETRRVIKQIDVPSVDRVLRVLRELKWRYHDNQDPGRLFLCGNGGGAGHASHAAADFRMAGVEAYCLSDNVSRLTALENDRGYDGALALTMRESRFDDDDVLFVFSVGGGDDLVSRNLVTAMAEARRSHIVGIVGARGGKVAEWGNAIVIPSDSTPIVEGIQAVLWHHLVTELAKPDPPVQNLPVDWWR